MTRLLSILFSMSLFAFAAPTRAFTPESGWWWNSAEPGYGFSIEIQDNFIFMVAFSYEDGQATWYAAQGEMVDNASFTAPLYRRDNGTCLGCPFVPPSSTYAVGSDVSIEFLTETTANLTWGDRTIAIERQDYYLSRNPAADPKTELWLGEWQIVMDWSAFPSQAAYPFFGEVLVFDVLDTSGSVDFFDGCRPEDSVVGFCSDSALNNHDAAGYFCAGCGVNGQDVNFIVVNDEPTTDDFEGTWLVFEVDVGLYQFDGYAKRCPKTIAPQNLINDCLDNEDFPVLPSRGWRSASRAFVQGDDNAPSARLPAPKARDSVVAKRRPRSDLPLKVETATTLTPRHRGNLAAASATMQVAVERLRQR